MARANIANANFFDGDLAKHAVPSLHGRVALVVGGTRGLGTSISQALAHAGAHVCVTYSASESKAKEQVEALESLRGARAMSFKHDPSDSKQAPLLIQDVTKAFQRLDVLIHACSFALHGKTIDDPSVNTQALDLQWQVNVHGYIALVRVAAPHIRPGGRIIALSSSLAQRVGIPGVADYAGTKAAVLGYTRGVARDLAPRGITANVVLAGALKFETPRTRRGPMTGLYSQEDVRDEPVTTEDVVSAVMFLASSYAGAITGTALDVTGCDLA
ncbi:MAG: SDR family oxidoreductase [Edaphobacter sp.]|uniref:SDR family NAD(P)-dependent oxidoreductase n=1 Tax=Edaphobacter sp. TaxID=1934404 RepID=UPI002393FAAF|nr:SDR family oxidoreductase [Edaphobacter sp.]MDE1176358.1 SDR family oxidoreductase [Edaphobacter sp.]